MERTIYRQLLRLCKNGKNPEVLGHFGGYHAYINSNNSNNGQGDDLPSLPSSCSDVRRHLRRSFTHRDNDALMLPETTSDVAELYDGFSALRCAKERSSTFFWPTMEESISNDIGIFDFNSTAFLPYESGELNFFEPRYKLMARKAMEHDGKFILRGLRPSEFDDGVIQASVLCNIIQHAETADGQNVMVQFQAGPRVDITNEIQNPMSGDDEGNLPLSVASSVQILCDEFDAFDSEENIATLQEHVTSLLIELTSLAVQEENLDNNEKDKSLDNFWKRQGIFNMTRNGLPPLNAEQFSMWSLRFVLPPPQTATGTDLRVSWLAGRSTSARLRYSVDKLTEWISLKHKQLERTNDI